MPPCEPAARCVTPTTGKTLWVITCQDVVLCVATALKDTRLPTLKLVVYAGTFRAAALPVILMAERAVIASLATVGRAGKRWRTRETISVWCNCLHCCDLIKCPRTGCTAGGWPKPEWEVRTEIIYLTQGS